MNSEKKLRKDIFEMVAKYWEQYHKPEKFIPGISKVHYAGRVYDEKELIAMTDAVLDFWLTLGKNALEFEKRFSTFLHTKNTILTNSGSSANLLAISAFMSLQLKNRLKSGDEVITPALTFPTTFNPIVQNALVPVLADVETDTYNLDADKLEECLSDRTKMIMLPHTLGNPNDMGAVMDFASEHDLYVIEDTCDALGSKYNGRMLGTFGDIGTFSFFPAHHMTLGEGGALITDSNELSSIIRSLRDWGRACTCPECKIIEDDTYKCPQRFSFKTATLPKDYDKRYAYVNIGYNLKPLDIQAALGIEQLKKLPKFLKARKKNFKELYTFFSEYEDYFILPRSLPGAEPAWFAFPLTVKENDSFGRADIIKWLENNNIETRLLFAGNIVHQPGYRETKYRVAGDLTNSDAVMNGSFFIGVYPGIDKQRMDYMKDRIAVFMDRVKK
jgi:CDP-6-deoxy-D-xylo-4-hexulose-3-dehydrase